MPDDITKETWRAIGESFGSLGCSFEWVGFLFVLLVILGITSFVTGCWP